jgi:intracellular multiplication protein IcmE
VQKRVEREELVAGAAASPDVAVKDSAAAAVVARALDRAKAAIPPASAAEFRAAAAPAAAVGHVLVAEAVVDPEDGIDAADAAHPLAVAAISPAACDWTALKNDGYTARELRSGGCSFPALLALEYDLPSLKAAGYDLATFRAGGFSWAEMKTAGFTARELRLAGCDWACAKAAGFDVSSLVVSFGYDAVAATGCDVSSCVIVSRTPALLLTQPHTYPPPSPRPLSATAPTCT